MNCAKPIPETKITAVPATNKNIRERCCCNCQNNIRIKNPNNPAEVIRCECKIDHHLIGYVQTFTDCCPQWRKISIHLRQ